MLRPRLICWSHASSRSARRILAFSGRAVSLIERIEIHVLGQQPRSVELRNRAEIPPCLVTYLLDLPLWLRRTWNGASCSKFCGTRAERWFYICQPQDCGSHNDCFNSLLLCCSSHEYSFDLCHHTPLPQSGHGFGETDKLLCLLVQRTRLGHRKMQLSRSLSESASSALTR